MTLSEYIASNRGNAKKLANEMGVSQSFVSQLASGHRSISPVRACLIEKFSSGSVSRKSLRPADWQLIWPDLNDSQIQNKQVS